MTSVWLRPERTGRGPAPEHTRADLARAAVELADGGGLGAVTMRSVAAAVGTGQASLYRYVANRDELVDLMADHVNAELSYERLPSGGWLTDLLELAHQSRGVYLRHPWMLDVTRARAPLGPRAVDYLEQALAAMADLDVPYRTKMEAVGVLGGLVALLVRAELDHRAAGQSVPEWQQAQTAYLATVLQAGRHPHLAAALAAATDAEPTPAEELFDRVVTRVLSGLVGGTA
jgi:AcrR family transcriptional regulator